jgi:phage terminase large subunit-like protein
VDEGSGGKRVYHRLTSEERGRFLQVLRETGNRKAAAAAIGVEPRLMDQRREHERALDRQWTEAMTSGGGYRGSGSPDRADAMVWAMTELMLGRRRAPPRIRLL